MIQDWPGALYKKDDTAFLCWTYSPEVTYVLEYTPSKIDDSEIIKMAESAEPDKIKTTVYTSNRSVTVAFYLCAGMIFLSFLLGKM